MKIEVKEYVELKKEEMSNIINYFEEEMKSEMKDVNQHHGDEKATKEKYLKYMDNSVKTSMDEALGTITFSRINKLIKDEEANILVSEITEAWIEATREAVRRTL